MMSTNDTASDIADSEDRLAQGVSAVETEIASLTDDVTSSTTVNQQLLSDRTALAAELSTVQQINTTQATQIVTLQSELANATGGTLQLYGVLAQDMATLTRIVDFNAVLGAGWVVSLTNGELPASAILLPGALVRGSGGIAVSIGQIVDLTFTATKEQQAQTVRVRLYCEASELSSPYLSQVSFAGKTQIPAVDDLGVAAISTNAEATIDSTSLVLADTGEVDIALQADSIISVQAHASLVGNGAAVFFHLVNASDGSGLVLAANNGGAFIFVRAADGTVDYQAPIATQITSASSDVRVSYLYTPTTQELFFTVNGQVAYNDSLSRYIGPDPTPSIKCYGQGGTVRLYSIQQQLSETSYVQYHATDDTQTLLAQQMLTPPVLICPDVHVEQGDKTALLRMAMRWQGNRCPLRSYQLEVYSQTYNPISPDHSHFSQFVVLYPSRECYEEIELLLDPGIEAGNYYLYLDGRAGSQQNFRHVTANIIVHVKGSLPMGYVKPTTRTDLPAAPVVPLTGQTITHQTTEPFSDLSQSQFRVIESDINYMLGRAVDPYRTGPHSITKHAGTRPNPFVHVPAGNGDDAHLEIRPVDCRNDQILHIDGDQTDGTPCTGTAQSITYPANTVPYYDSDHNVQHFSGTVDSLPWATGWFGRRWQDNEKGEFELTIYDRHNTTPLVAANCSLWAVNNGTPLTERDDQETTGAYSDSGYSSVLFSSTWHNDSTGQGPKDFYQAFYHFDINQNRRFKTAILRRYTPGKEGYWGFIQNADGTWTCYEETTDFSKGKRFDEELFMFEGPGGTTGGIYDPQFDYSTEAFKVYPMVHQVLAAMPAGFVDFTSLNQLAPASLFVS